MTFVEYLWISFILISCNLYSYEAAVVVFSIEELRFRKVKQFVEGHMADLDETLVYLQSPCAFHCLRITGVLSRHFREDRAQEL